MLGCGSAAFPVVGIQFIMTDDSSSDSDSDLEIVLLAVQGAIIAASSTFEFFNIQELDDMGRGCVDHDAPCEGLFNDHPINALFISNNYEFFCRRFRRMMHCRLPSYYSSCPLNRSASRPRRSTPEAVSPTEIFVDQAPESTWNELRIFFLPSLYLAKCWL